MTSEQIFKEAYRSGFCDGRGTLMFPKIIDEVAEALPKAWEDSDTKVHAAAVEANLEALRGLQPGDVIRAAGWVITIRPDYTIGSRYPLLDVCDRLIPLNHPEALAMLGSLVAAGATVIKAEGSNV